jgi:hypothetical protein
VDLSNALLVPGEADVAAWHETLEKFASVSSNHDKDEMDATPAAAKTPPANPLLLTKRRTVEEAIKDAILVY